MESSIKNIFKNKKVNLSKLMDFGFSREGADYIYRKPLLNGEFNLTVNITERGEVSAEVIDTDSKEIYTLHLSENAVGSFVGQIRCGYNETLEEISQSCFEPNVFKMKQSKELISYVRDTYGDELEFLWEKFDDNSIWRRKDTKKWYAALLTVQKSKLGIKSDEIAEVIDLRIQPGELDKLVDNKLYFRGYHMNKRHWLTIILNGSVPLREICRRIDESYALAKK